MRTLLAAALLALAVSGSPASLAQAPSKSSDKSADVTDLQQLRAAIQRDKRAFIAEKLNLTDAEARKFWPVYDAYQKEHRTIIEEQLKGIQRYVEAFDTLDDAGALALIKAHLDRDERMNTLRQKALVDLQRAVGTRLAARAIQIDRRLSLAHQLEIVSKIPLIR